MSGLRQPICSRRRLRRRLECYRTAALVCSDVGGNHRCDYASGHRSENVVTVHHPPLVSMWGGTEMGIVVIDMLTPLPILVMNFGAFLPIVMTDVMVVV